MITCLISSPRKNGFGASIAAKAVEGAESAGKTVSVHHLNDMTSYRQCQNCGGCKNNGCHCVLKDDITPILEEIRDAEGLILCTSINFNDTNGLFKLVFDRLYSFLDMNSCSAMPKGKKVAVIVTAGADDTSAERVSVELEKIMEQHFYCQSVGRISYCTWFMPLDMPMDPEVLDRAFQIGTRFRDC